MKYLIYAAMIAVIAVGVATASNSHHSLGKLAVPGERYHAVTQATLGTTVCRPGGGYTSTIRPPQSYTSALKRWLLKDRNLPGTVSDYQLDHAISLELGGAPYSTRNLWMEPEPQAHITDGQENKLRTQLCDSKITLKQAQAQELAYKRANG